MDTAIVTPVLNDENAIAINQKNQPRFGVQC